MSALGDLLHVAVNVQSAQGRPLNIPFSDSISIANSMFLRAENVAIRVELTNGSVGWGEAPTLRPITAEDQSLALAKVTEVCDMLAKIDTEMPLSSLLSEVGRILQGHKFVSVSYLHMTMYIVLVFGMLCSSIVSFSLRCFKVRAGVEMALIDAVANMIGVPLWRVFGGVSNTISTDITVKSLFQLLP